MAHNYSYKIEPDGVHVTFTRDDGITATCHVPRVNYAWIHVLDAHVFKMEFPNKEWNSVQDCINEGVHALIEDGIIGFNEPETTWEQP